MQAINTSGIMTVGSTVYRDIAIDICDGCILTTFMLATLGVWMQEKEEKNDVRQLTQRVHEELLTRGLTALIVGNAAIAVVLMLSTLRWTTT